MNKPFSAVTEFVHSYVHSGKCAGMQVLVSIKGDTKIKLEQGCLDKENNRPLREDSIFRIYSMTKPVTSVAIMQLMEKQELALDDPAKKWIPKIARLKVHKQGPLVNDITIRQLLTHTAGFSYGFYPEEIEIDQDYQVLWKNKSQFNSLDSIIDAALDIPLLAQPGTMWHYSIATDICGHLVELISGQTLEDYFQEHIFSPLGMSDTAFWISEDKLDRFTMLYGVDENQQLVPAESRQTSPFIPSHSKESLRWCSGGGGLVSTASDYWRFAQMMLNQGELDGAKILSPHSVQQMTQNQVSQELLPLSFNGIARGEYSSYGFGLGYGITMNTEDIAASGSIGDFGWGGLADTYCWIDPQNELVAILMQQVMPSLHFNGRRDFRNAVYKDLEEL